ncbi:MAG: hypothetical protein ACO1O6_07270 [Bacteroidota bacterium]
MENFKVKLDRPKISSEEIASKQNFDNVLSTFNQAKPPAYKNPWFWGSAGLATVGVTTILTLNAFTLKNETDDKNITLKTNPLPEDTKCIKAPVAGEDIPFKTYEVNPLKDEKIVLASGTTIEIDKGTLLPEKNNETVEIKVREFHDQASVFISGIPMDYQKDAFESAGMIEIKGEQDGDEVKINPEKPINIELKTVQNPETFGFWFLNQDKKAWESYPAEINASTPNTSGVSEKQVQQAEQKVEQTEKKIAGVEKEIAQVITPKKEEYKIPGKNTQLFDLDFDKNDYPELSAFKNIIFEVVHPNGYDPDFAKNSKKNWSSVDLQKSKERYTAFFKNSSESYNVQVRPVLQGSDLKKAEKEFDLALQSAHQTKAGLENKKKKLLAEKKSSQEALNELIKKQLAEQDRQSRNRYNQLVQTSAELKELNDRQNVNANVAAIQDYSNSVSFQTTRWGVFNSDKQIAYPEPFKIGVALLWVGSQVAKFKQIFVFNKDKNTRYSYGEGFRPIENLGFRKNDDLVLVGIDFEGNIGYCEIKKEDQVKGLEKISFTRKDKSTKTLDLLKSLMDGTTDTV